MGAFSKPWPTLSELSCYEIAHTVEPSCWRAWLVLSYKSIISSFKIYATLYLVSSIFRGDIFSYLKSRFLSETLRSTAFLASNSGLFLFAFCLLRFLTGRVFFLMPFLASAFASYCAILIEKPSKRSSLASYVCMLATECIHASLKDAGILKDVPYGDVLILGAALVWLSFLAPVKLDQPQQQDTATFVMKLLSSVPADTRWRKFLSKIVPENKEPNHQHGFHPHDLSCRRWMVDGLVRGCLYGLLLDLIFLLTSRGGRSHHSFNLLSSTSVLLSTLLFLFRLCMCSSSRFLPNLSPVFRRCVSCLLSAFAFILSKKKGTIPLWLFFKGAQLSAARVSEKMPAAVVNQIPLCLFALATAYLLHQGCYEAHTIRPSYWSFLLRLTGGWFGIINRRLLSGFHPNADRIVAKINDGDRNWWPRYDPTASLQWTGPTAIPSFILDGK